MIIDKDFKPKPSDFGKFVYCRKKWFLKYEKPLVKKSDDEKNEDKCIKWVCEKEQVTEKQIVFDGTGKDNLKRLTSEIESVSMRCKPDLIINKDGHNLLFEFKKVDKPGYLDLPEFDSVHAQVWCYTKLKEYKINEYHLLRYYKDPYGTFAFSSPRRYTHKMYDHKVLSSNELVSSRFIRIFEEYIKLVELFKLKEYERKDLILMNPNDKELVLSICKLPNKKDLKCPNCIRRKKGYCHLYKP